MATPEEIYDRFYLCWKKDSQSGVKCVSFDTIKEAEKHNYNNSKVFPICKYSPKIFDRLILKYEIMKLVNVTILKSPKN